MKKVFSRIEWLTNAFRHCDKFNLESLVVDGSATWVNECDGLTEEEMEEMGYGTVTEWMVEYDQYRKVSDLDYMRAVKALLKLL